MVQQEITMQRKLFKVPDREIYLIDDPEKLTFFDQQTVSVSQKISPLDGWAIIMSKPSRLLKAAFWIRDMISVRFGVKRIGGFSSNTPSSVSVGDMLDFFRVEQASPTTLSLSERDRHLDVLTCITTSNHELTITSSVVTHNTFGKIYMLPVGPAHKWIVRRFLNRISKELRHH